MVNPVIVKTWFGYLKSLSYNEEIRLHNWKRSSASSFFYALGHWDPESITGNDEESQECDPDFPTPSPQLFNAVMLVLSVASWKK